MANIPSVLAATPDGEVGPPLGILLADTILGIIGLVATILAWRTGSRVALRVLAGSVILITLSALPAFFVDSSTGVKLLVGLATLIAVAIVMLLLSGQRGQTKVTD